MKNGFSSKLGLLLLLGMFFYGCDGQEKKKKAISPDEVLEKTQEALELSKKFFLQEKEAFEKKAHERLEKLREKIERLKKTAINAEEGIEEIQNHLEQLDKREKELKEKLDGIQNQISLDELQKGFDDAMKKLEDFQHHADKKPKEIK